MCDLLPYTAVLYFSFSLFNPVCKCTNVRMYSYVKFTVEQTIKAQREEDRYSSTLFLTSALNGVGGQRHAPATLPPGSETQNPFYRRLGGPRGQLDGCRKSFLHRDSIPGQRVAILTTLSRATRMNVFICINALLSEFMLSIVPYL
jgi:hypothetical protein